MKRKLFFLALFLSATAGLLGASKVKVLQGEDGDVNNHFQPDYAAFPSLTFIQGTPLAADTLPGTSSHATQVLNILSSGPATGLIESVTIANAASYQGRVSETNPVGLNGNRTTLPAVATWELENHSWGGNDPTGEDDLLDTDGTVLRRGILGKFADRLARDNVLAFVAVPNSDQGSFRLLNSAVSPYLVKVGTTSTGMALTSENQPDIYTSVAYTSFSTPTVARTGIAMISWCKDNGIAYNAADLKTILLNSATIDGSGRRILNHSATMAALPLFYFRHSDTPANSLPTPVPAPLPVVTAPSAVDASVSVSVAEGAAVTLSVACSGTEPFTYQWYKDGAPVVGATAKVREIAGAKAGDTGTYYARIANAAGSAESKGVRFVVAAKAVPPPAPTPTPAPTLAPSIRSFSHNAAWAPARLSWDTENASLVTLTDPNGRTIIVAPRSSYNVTKTSKGYVWTLKATNAAGQTVTKIDEVHGVLDLP